MRLRHWIAALGIVVSCGSPNPASAETLQGEGSLDGDMHITLELTPKAGAETVEVVVAARVRRGRAVWTLTDPNGDRVFEGEADKGTVELHSGEIEAIPGIWRLEMRAENTRMKYEISTEGLDVVE